MKATQLSALSPTEKRLWNAFGTGGLVDLRSTPDDGPQDAASWGPEREVRAEVIVALLTGAGQTRGGGIPGVRLAGARIVGGLMLANAVVEHPVDFERCDFDTGVAVPEATTRSIRMRGCYLPYLEAARLHLRGELLFQGCRLDWMSLYAARVDEVEISGTTLTRPGDIAFNGDLLTVAAAMYAHEMQVEGQFRLPGARVGGYLELDGSSISHDGTQAAVFAPGLRVETGLFAHRGTYLATKPPFTVEGGVNLDAAEIRGGLWMPDARVAGGIRLSAARIIGPVDLSAAMLESLSTEALLADHIHVDGAVLCHDGFHAQGTLSFLGAQITGRFSLGATSEGAAPSILNGTVDLRQARIGTLCDDQASWPPRLRLDGLVYDELTPQLDARRRLSWLARGEFQSQPFEQLATRFRAVGRDADARRVLLARQRHRRSAQGPAATLWGLAQDATVGYGYRPWLAGFWLLGLLAAGTSYFAGHRPQPTSRAGSPHFNALAYTLDLLVPVVSLGQSNAWDPVGTGQVVAYALILSGWTLATALIAGLTRGLARS